jgi:hypothetical protein
LPSRDRKRDASPSPSVPIGDSSLDHLSEMDRRILQLQREGYSYRNISRLLKQRYGIKLSPKGVGRHIIELQQDPTLNIKANFKTPKRSKENDRWYQIVLKLVEYLPRYLANNNFKASVRTAFYDFVDAGDLLKHEYGHFDAVTVIARMGWKDSNGDLIYPKLDMDCFAEDTSRKVIDRYDDSEPIEMQPPGDEIPDESEYIEDFIEDLKSAVESYAGVAEEGSDGERGGYWYNQPEYVEVWQEKNDLLDGFDTIFRSRHIRIRSNKGWSSTLWLDHCCNRLKDEIIAKKGIAQENIWIGYAGDWDPSGAHMLQYIKNRLRLMGLGRVNVERIAVTPEQIDKYHLPLMSIDPEPGKKPDPNLHEFRRKYGDKATHLNAFFTETHIKDFKKIALAFVDRHWQQDIYDRMVKEYEIEAPAPDMLTPEELHDARLRMIRKINDAFAPGWENELNFNEGDADADD